MAPCSHAFRGAGTFGLKAIVHIARYALWLVDLLRLTQGDNVFHFSFMAICSPLDSPAGSTPASTRRPPHSVVTSFPIAPILSFSSSDQRRCRPVSPTPSHQVIHCAGDCPIRCYHQSSPYKAIPRAHENGPRLRARAVWIVVVGWPEGPLGTAS